MFLGGDIKKMSTEDMIEAVSDCWLVGWLEVCGFCFLKVYREM